MAIESLGSHLNIQGVVDIQFWPRDIQTQELQTGARVNEAPGFSRKTW